MKFVPELIPMNYILDSEQYMKHIEFVTTFYDLKIVVEGTDLHYNSSRV